MRNLLLTLCFDGSFFSGWQIQQNAPSVQAAFQAAVTRQFGHCPSIKGCSRTDAGVHASMFCVNMKTELALTCDRMVYALNCALPPSIAVTSCREVPDGFHARYDCVRKRYLYKICNAPIRDPFVHRYALNYRHRLDAVQLHKSAQAYVGTHDFSAFQSAGSKIQDPVRTIYEASVVREEDWILFSVEGDGFLYNMVRIMVGTLLGIAQERIPPNAIPDILNSKDRTRAGVTAPPQGLYLTDVQYPQSIEVKP